MMKRLALIVLASMALWSCGKSGGTAPDDTFDRSAMLRDMAERWIVPSYVEASATAHAMSMAIDGFTAVPSQQTLNDARQAWTTAVDAWERVVLFDFGPAEGLYGDLTMNAGTFPASPTKIERFVTAGDTSMQNFDRDSRGYLSIDYFLYDGSDVDIVARFSGSENAARRAYLRTVARTIDEQIAVVSNAWNTSYVTTFVQHNGTDAGSSVSELVNSMAMSFEVLKNDKVGTPAGKRVGQSGPDPRRVEAYYSGRSVVLMRRHFAAIKATWEGISDNGGATFKAFDDYLMTVTGGERLVTDTRVQIARVEELLAALPQDATLASLCASSDPRIETLHTELQKLTRFLKSEMSSVLGVAITYSSGDGD